MTPVYQETQPPADLQDVVACLWRRVVGGVEAGQAGPIIPDARGEHLMVTRTS